MGRRPICPIPGLDPGYDPFLLRLAEEEDRIAALPGAVRIRLGLERDEGAVEIADTWLPPDPGPGDGRLVRRLVKTLLWLYGGHTLLVASDDPGFGAARALAGELAAEYAVGGARAFDAGMMHRAYDRPLAFRAVSWANAPERAARSRPLGRHLDGCRIGLDLGGSDRKVSAVIDGRSVFSEEVVWHPKTMSDPSWHHREILSALRSAAARLPRVDAIGVSAAGIHVHNEVRVASLFMKVPDDRFQAEVRPMFRSIAEEMGGVPLELANDGDVTALAGAMSLSVQALLGIAMGTSQAAGFVDERGGIAGWLNELAFVPVDLRPDAPVDEWSGDRGCGVSYFSQEGVIRLAGLAGLPLPPEAAPAEKLVVVQERMKAGDPAALAIYETLGGHLGLALAGYHRFYHMDHVLVLGRVLSGEGGEIIRVRAESALARIDPDLSERVTLHLPDEASRRVGQSIAAASLPSLRS